MGSELGGIARRAYEAFAQRDLAVLLELSADDVEIHAVTALAAQREGPYRGADGLATYLEDVERVWDDIHLYPHEFIELDERRVLVLGRARVRAAGTTIDTPNAWLWEFRDHKVFRVQVLGGPESMKELLAAGAGE